MHMKRHNKDYKWFCEYCGKGFVATADYKEHVQAIHQQIQSFTCEVCSRAFGHRSAYYRHKRTSCDTQKKMHECSECGSTFNFKLSMHNHMWVTHGVIPEGTKFHQCQHCPEKFILKKNFKKHLVSHTKKLSYPCTMCSFASHHKTKLQAHMKVQHEVDEISFHEVYPGGSGTATITR